jgi:hypothetical protein
MRGADKNHNEWIGTPISRLVSEDPIAKLEHPRLESRLIAIYEQDLSAKPEQRLHILEGLQQVHGDRSPQAESVSSPSHVEVLKEEFKY